MSSPDKERLNLSNLLRPYLQTFLESVCLPDYEFESVLVAVTKLVLRALSGSQEGREQSL